jgi:hypothetical protein
MGSKHPTSDSSPTPPNPLAPPGAGEPNSHIWPTLLIHNVQTVKHVASFHLDQFGGVGGVPKMLTANADRSAGTSCLHSVGQIWLLAAAPGGVERGGGDRGGNKLRSGKEVGGAGRLSRNAQTGALLWRTAPLIQGEGKIK